jgi:hypothetical protein
MNEYQELFRIIEMLISENDRYKQTLNWITKNFANGSSDYDFCKEVYERALEALKPSN